MKRLLTLVLLAVWATAFAAFPPLRLGLGLLAGGSPINLPLLTSGQVASMFTFEGSFTLGNGSISGFYGGLHAITVSGSTMYGSATFYDPDNTNNLLDGGGYGSFTLPTLVGAPAYDGSNATVSAANTTCSYNPSNYCVPMAPGTYVWNANYTLSPTPTGGDTTETFTSLPAGMAANVGWEIKFSTGHVSKVTNVAGSTVTLDSALPAGTYTATVTVHQWHPADACGPNGGGGGYRLTGAMIYSGSLYVTCGTWYDSTSNDDIGWIAKTDPASPGSGWGVQNGETGVSALCGTSPNRYLAGPVYPVPAIWQSYLGKAFESSGAALSVNGNCVPWGYTLMPFDPTNVQSTGTPTVPVSSGLAYYNAYPYMLAKRYLVSTPLPLAENGVGQNYYPATLTAAPIAGATTANLNLPSATVTLTANTTYNQNNITVTAISGTMSNSGISYLVNDGGVDFPANSPFYPSYDQTPGATLGLGTYKVGQPALHTATGDTLTLTPKGYQSNFYMIWFVDGDGSLEQRVAFLSGGADGSSPVESSIPYSATGSGVPATLVTLNADGSLGSTAPLVCTMGCTTNIYLAPLGDKYWNTYDSGYGGAFIVPNTRTFAVIVSHQFGTQRGRGAMDVCSQGNASGSDSVPLYPDTQPYIKINVNLYDLQDIVNSLNDPVTYPPYAINPYASVSFPDEANLESSVSSVGCFVAAYPGWIYEDPATNILYMAWPNHSTGGNRIYEYQVTPP